MLEKIGEGRTSKVYLSDDIVIKRIEKSWYREEEIDVLKKLDHHSIIKLLNNFKDDYYVYLFLEYFPGKDLYAWKNEIDNKNPEIIDDVITQLLNVIKYIHNENIIHGDLSVTNVLINKNRVKIIDFGNSRKSDKNTLIENGKIYGTFPFLSPELLSGEILAPNKKSDLWALGILLFIIITGNIPFDGHYISSISFRISNCKINYKNIPKKYIKSVKSLLRKKYVKRKIKFIKNVKYLLE